MMKKYFILFVAFMVATATNAQMKPIERATINLTSLQKDEFCKTRLLNYLDSYKSIIYKQLNLSRQQLVVKYATDRITPNQIRTIIRNAGFDTDSIRASEDAYWLLPPQCRRPEDRGLPPKK